MLMPRLYAHHERNTDTLKAVLLNCHARPVNICNYRRQYFRIKKRRTVSRRLSLPSYPAIISFEEITLR